MKGKLMSRFLAVALLCATLGACAAPTTSGSAAMATDTKDTKPNVTTFCMGRFVIDLPAGSTISGGNYKYDFARIDKPRAMNQAQFEKETGEREAKLRASKHRKEPSLLRSSQRPGATSLVLAFWEEDFSEYQVKVDGYKWAGGVSFLVRDQVDTSKQDFGLKRMTEILSRLGPRPDTEIPTEPGYCFGGGFIANAEWENEQAGIDFRIAGQPDVGVSVDILPVASRKRDKPLLDRMGGALSQLGNMASMVRVLRKGDREIASFKGQEYLVTGPNSGGLRGHSFIWETQGEGTLQEPSIRIEFVSSRQDEKGNPQQTKLTDEQALALWDRIVSSFRLRPVNDAPSKKTSDAGPLAPLGTTSVTGRVCPQTGLWACDEDAAALGGGTQYLHAGERMPHAVVTPPPSMWQRLRGQAPTQRLATVWTLVDYDEPTAPVLPQAPAAPEAASPKQAEQPASDTPDQPDPPDPQAPKG
jgi:Tle cognate immunity protein 4 C-terminal domain/Tle cognate immunity protein 4 N-terminal domain